MIQDARTRFAFLAYFLMLSVCGLPAVAQSGEGLIRSRQPDRGTYQPPTLAKTTPRPAKVAATESQNQSLASDHLVDAPLDQPSVQTTTAPAPVVSQSTLPSPIVLSQSPTSQDSASANLVRTVSYEHHAAPQGGQPSHPGHVAACSCESCNGGGVTVPMPPSMPHEFYASEYVDGEVVFDSGCDAAPGCDSNACDSVGSFCGPTDAWFGSVELMLMFRKGDRLPPLASDGTLDDTTTQVFAGGETVYQDITAGGRLQIGAWLDNYKDRHLVARGWFAGEQSFGFNANENTHPTLVRPFFNVTDGVVPPIDDTRIIATPGDASGALSIQGDSNTYGADISIRQLWYKRYGGTVDLLYGYQFMGLDESLRISDRSTSLSDGVRPIGSVLATSDTFDVENAFHGGQIGVASNYREGCWSFSSLAKIGFGSVRRQATLTGNTFTSIDGNNATDPNGLLVRSTNAGTHSDDTFGWAPELDLTVGWQRFPSFDITFGYHIAAMTDALRVGGVIDPNLASNLADPPVGAQRPSPNFRYGTFYVQGIHFGLSYVY